MTDAEIQTIVCFRYLPKTEGKPKTDYHGRISAPFSALSSPYTICNRLQPSGESQNIGIRVLGLKEEKINPIIQHHPELVDDHQGPTDLLVLDQGKVGD